MEGLGKISTLSKEKQEAMKRKKEYGAINQKLMKKFYPVFNGLQLIHLEKNEQTLEKEHENVINNTA